jgi:hypothetical protein
MAEKSIADQDSISMIFYTALKSDKPALVGLTEGTAVIKRLGAGDDGLSFEELYDIAITPKEMKAMREHNVDSPDKLPLPLYRAHVAVVRSPVLTLRIQAKGPSDIRNRLAKLAQNEEFKKELFSHIMAAWIC